MYTKSYDQGLTMEFDEYTLKLPDQPPDNKITNWRLPISQQKFAYEQLPDFKTMNVQELENYSELMWHKRVHGEYQWINGKKIYICGGAWFFFNFWTTQGEATRF